MFSINLKGKIAFVAGIGDDRGFGWAIAKALLEAGATVIVGTWPPVYKIFTESFNKGSFDESRVLSDGSLMNFAKVYALDAAFCFPDQVPEEIKTNKRYAQHEKFTISEVAEAVYKEFGKIDILVHSLANGPEVKNPLLKTSRKGYLEALSASSYSFVSLLQHFGPHMNPGSSYLGLTYMASEKAVKGYGGGMSSAKAALESDTRTLALEAGREWGIRVNCISAGAYASRAATAIGFIGNMINYAKANAPLTRPLEGEDVGAAAAFLLSPLAAAITGSIVYVDNGMHAMGTSLDSPELQA